jgi:hypothetical protein
MKKILLVLLLITMVITSCATADDSGSKTTESNVNAETIETAAEETKEEYVYPDVDYNGEEFWMINVEPVWGYYPNLDFENMTGDVLDDAVYQRNRLLEEKLNFTFKVKDVDIGQIYSQVRTLLTAGEDVYDAIMITGHEVYNLILENMLYNLYDVPQLNLEKDWWEQTVLKTISYGDPPKAYFGSNYMNLFGFQSTYITYFNEAIVENLGLTMPYEYVDKGTWTFDVMHEQIKAGMSLNGDDSYKWSADGNCVYGFSTYEQAQLAFMIGMGANFIEKDSTGYPYLAVDNERFYSICEKLAAFMGTEGEFLNANDNSDSGWANHYERIFAAGRAFYIVGEIKASNTFRTMDDNFGILPMPKYDENQAEYKCNRLNQSLMVAIPITNPDVDRAGTVLETMAYQSFVDVLPVFYDYTVSQKGLRNEDSIRMMDIIRGSRYYDIGIGNGWTQSLVDSVSNLVRKGDANVASAIATQAEKIAASIDKSMNIG